MVRFYRALGRSALLAVLLPAASLSAPPDRPAPRPMPMHHRPAYAPPGELPQATLLPNAAAGLARPYGGPPIDVTTYHYDQGRTGWNQSETDLTPATVASAKFGLLHTLNVDGNVFAQPLLVSGLALPDGTTHDVLIIATGHNSVYAFDARTYAGLWQVNLGVAQSSNDVGCADVKPEYGISSTPVIVRSAKRAILYLVAATEPQPMTFDTRLHALDVATGRPVVPSVEIAPEASLSDGTHLKFDAQNQWSRAGLAYANGTVYVAIGSHCDHNRAGISGWVVRYRPNLKPLAAFHTIETPATTELASIWMTGFAPAVDPAGNLFAVTGNGNYDLTQRHRDYGESVLKLPATLGHVISSFTPARYQTLNTSDVDFGSGGVMLLPPLVGQTAPPLAVAIGKDAVLYLLNGDKLGGLRDNDVGALQATRVAGSGLGLWGGPAFYNGPGGGLVYVQVNGDVLRAFSVAAGAAPSLTQAVVGTSKAGFGGSLPIVSSNGGAAGSGVVWLARRSNAVQIEAYNATSLGAPIYAASAGAWSNPAQQNPFLTPLEANGRVYVPAYKSVEVFGLTP